MTGRIATRLDALEDGGPQPEIGVRLLHWGTGQSFEEVLDAHVRTYGPDHIADTDRVLVRYFYEDPAVDREWPKFLAWKAEREARAREAQAGKPGRRRHRKGWR